MADVINLAQHRAAASVPDTTHPETIRLHGLATNALATALHHLQSLDSDPAKLALATARAVRAATALKRLSAINAEVAA